MPCRIFLSYSSIAGGEFDDTSLASRGFEDVALCRVVVLEVVMGCGLLVKRLLVFEGPDLTGTCVCACFTVVSGPTHVDRIKSSAPGQQSSGTSCDQVSGARHQEQHIRRTLAFQPRRHTVGWLAGVLEELVHCVYMLMAASLGVLGIVTFLIKDDITTTFMLSNLFIYNAALYCELLCCSHMFPSHRGSHGHCTVWEEIDRRADSSSRNNVAISCSGSLPSRPV